MKHMVNYEGDNLQAQRNTRHNFICFLFLKIFFNDSTFRKDPNIFPS